LTLIIYFVLAQCVVALMRRVELRFSHGIARTASR